MNLKQFTTKAQESVQEAVQLANMHGHQSIEPAHLLKGILDTDDNVTPFLFKKLQINGVMAEKALDKMIESFPKVSGGQPYLSGSSNQVVGKAAIYLKEFNDEYISIEHLLMAILSVKDPCGQMLRDAGMSEKDLKAAIKELRKGNRVTSQSAEETYNALNKFAIHLNEQARKGKLDPVIGRDEEIRRVLQILSRRTKNNPILVGEPGVGKTAIAEGLAHRIINGGMKVIIEELQSAPNIILFIDEIHQIVGAGNSSGSLDA